MSKTVSQALQAANIGAAPSQQEDLQSGVKGLFMLFHGWYGALLLARYTTGDVDQEGKDRGIKSAMVVWQKELDGFDGDVIRAAANRCMADHPKYPPTLPEFVAICKATQPRRAAPESQFKIPMSTDLKSSYTARARAKAMTAYRAKVDAEAGVVKAGDGLGSLQVLVARAVGLAGGNEVAVLRSFDREA